jgi:hypothetical protein
MPFQKNVKQIRYPRKPSLRTKKAVAILASEGGSVANALRKAGFAPGSIRNPQVMTKTEVWKQEAQPYLDRLTAMREKILAEMENKDLRGERFKTLSESLQRTNHDVQLLSGGRTENVGIGGIAAEFALLI